jgi:hypothetical protein
MQTPCKSEKNNLQGIKPQYGSDRTVESLSPERKDPFASGSDTGKSSYKTLIGKHSQARDDKRQVKGIRRKAGKGVEY